MSTSPSPSKRIVGPLGAYLYPQPARTGAPVAVLPAGMAVRGVVVRGEQLHDEARWVCVAVSYVWMGRLIEPPPIRIKPICMSPRCKNCGQFVGRIAHHCAVGGDV